MPERQSGQRIATPIQGDDAWVRIKRIQVGQWLQLQEDGGSRSLAEATRRGLEILRDHVLEWNWVDDDGNPLPQPKDDPDVINRLTDEEALALINIIQGPTPERLKN